MASMYVLSFAVIGHDKKENIPEIFQVFTVFPGCTVKDRTLKIIGLI